jgi:hypothetical protein
VINRQQNAIPIGRVHTENLEICQMSIPFIWKAGPDALPSLLHFSFSEKPHTNESASRTISLAFGELDPETFTLSQNGKKLQKKVEVGPVQCTFVRQMTVKFEDEKGLFVHDFPDPTPISLLRRFLAVSCYYCEPEKLVLFRDGVRVRDNLNVNSGNVDRPFSVLIDRSDNICVCFRYSDPKYYPKVVYDCRLGFNPSSKVTDAITKLSECFKIDRKFLKICDSTGNFLSLKTRLASVAHLLLYFHGVRDEHQKIRDVQNDSPASLFVLRVPVVPDELFLDKVGPDDVVRELSAEINRRLFPTDRYSLLEAS